MLKRLLVGLIIGGVVGAALATALVRLLGIQTWDGIGSSGPMVWHTLVGYVAAAVTGMLVGLVTGKPIWAAGGKIEAGLKAAFGALLGAGILFALRQWVPLQIDLASLGAGHGKLGDLPAVALPAIGALLGGFYGADNTDDGAAASSEPKKRVRTAPAATTSGDDEVEAEDEAPRKMKR